MGVTISNINTHHHHDAKATTWVASWGSFKGGGVSQTPHPIAPMLDGTHEEAGGRPSSDRGLGGVSLPHLHPIKEPVKVVLKPRPERI
jgi:hypothetical protein